MNPILSTFLLAALLAPAFGWSQGYPTRTVRIIVPYPPGGATDLVSRVVGQKLSEHWGQQVVVDNRPGASGMIGTELTARSAPDGYTIVIGGIGALAINPSLFSKVPYDPVTDLAALTTTGNIANLLVAHPSIPATTVKEVIALARARPGQLTFASSSIGAAPHLAIELFKILAKVDVVHVPYKGGGPAIIDLIGGQVSFSFATMPSSLPHVRAGKLRAIATSSAQRSPITPEIPTIAESGLPGFVVNDWQGLLTTGRTPPEIVNRLNADIVRVLKLPDVREKLSTVGMELATSSPEEFAALIKSEIAKWAVVIKRAGIKAE